MRSLLAVSLVLVCFIDLSDGTFADFMNNLPTEISKAFSTAWGSMQDAIKDPVKIKRLGTGGRLKTTTTARSINMKQPNEGLKRRYGTTIEINVPPPHHPVYELTTHQGTKMTIPHLQSPPRIMIIGNRRYVLYDYEQRMNRCC